jgi:hypothetical protein
MEHFYYIIFTAVAFPPCCSGRQTCTKIGKRQVYTKGETIHKKNTKTQNTQNRNQTYKTRKQT